MNLVPYRYFILEALKITLFSLIITGIFKWMGASNDEILVLFNMIVMSAAATFSPEKQSFTQPALGSLVVVVSIVLGGLSGYYEPLLSKVLIIIYAGLAFLLPNTKSKTNIFVTGAITFLIFASLPFNLNDGLKYLLHGMAVTLLFSGLTWLMHITVHSHLSPAKAAPSIDKHRNAIIAVSALMLAWLIAYLLKTYTTLTHLYWIALTVLVVIQAAQQKNIHVAIKRIVVNFLGAVIIVLLFNYVIPTNFWINFSMLVILLFLIFALGFSFVWRTLFIELFVLGFTHLLGSYKMTIAFDRVILTLIGGGLVILMTLGYQYILTRRP